MNKDQHKANWLYRLTVLFICWIPGIALAYIIMRLSSPKDLSVTELMQNGYLVILLPLFCTLWASQYSFLKEFLTPEPTSYQLWKRRFFGAFFLAFVYIILYANEKITALFSQYAYYSDMSIEISEGLFPENSVLNSLGFPVLGFCLGMVIFSVLRYPHALIALGLCISIPSCEMLISLIKGINYDLPCYIRSHGMGIVNLFVFLGFSSCLILMGIKEAFGFRSSPKTQKVSLQIIRWILLLPASIMIAVLVKFLIEAVFIPLSFGVEPLIYTGHLFSGFVFVCTGALIAPHHKIHTAIILTIILPIAGMVSFIPFSISHPFYWSVFLRTLLHTLSTTLGGILAAFVVYRFQKKMRNIFSSEQGSE